MQSAFLWYDKTSRSVTLDRIKEYLENTLGCTVRHTEWRLESYVVPQLEILQPCHLLLQINSDDYVSEEAEESVAFMAEKLSPNQRDRLLACNARLEFGRNDPSPVISDGEIISFAGFSVIDPAEPDYKSILLSLTEWIDGVLEDNVNGTIYTADQVREGK